MEPTDEILGLFQDSKQIFSVFDSLNKQRESAKLCDVILKISDDQIYAHSNVLASASPYFDSLFSEQDLPRAFSQRTPQIIEIHIDGPKDPAYKIAVRKVVDFMYTSNIYLDTETLNHVVEIAQIMQMNNVIAFCDLYQQGCYSCITEDTLVQKTRHEMDTQSTEDMIRSDKNPVSVFYNDEAKGWFQGASLKSAPIILRQFNAMKRRRGRPRKTTKEKTNDDSEKRENENESDLEKKNSSEKENYDGEEKPLDSIDKETKSIEKRDTPVKVSKRGRVIKPKKFSDDTVAYVKEEPVSDSETADIDNAEDRVSKNEIDNYEPEFGSHLEQRLLQKLVCDRCEFTCANLVQYNEHYKKHLHAEKKCTYCGWVCDDPSKTEEDFKEHLNKHKGTDPYFCTFCSRRFNTKAKLYQHLPKHSEMKPYVCDICNAGFKWKQGLKSHMTVHKDSKDYLCDICGFATAHKNQLKAHHLIHTGNTFKCLQCEYQTTKRSNLKFHMMTHSREKPHQCELCGQAFSLVKNMKRHMLLHKADRPFRCEKCTFCTTRFDKLREHYFKQHNIGEKPKKKMRLTEYLKMQEMVTCEDQDSVETIEAEVLNIGEDMETLELQVDETEVGTATAQILNVTSSTGESIPVTITQNGSEICYEIPVQLVTQEIVTEEVS